MFFVLFSAVCSVLVSVLLKVARRLGVDIAQAVTWNYLVASVLCALIWQPPLARLAQPGTPWLALLGLAAVLPSLFLVLATSVRRAGIVRTDMAQRLSLLLSLLAAFFLFGERATAIKIFGLALGLLAVIGILGNAKQASHGWRIPDSGGLLRCKCSQYHWVLLRLCSRCIPSRIRARRIAEAYSALPLSRPGCERTEKGGSTLPVLLAVWIGFAAVDVMLKQIAAAGTPFAASLQVSFALAFIGLAAWQALLAWRGAARLTWRSLISGLLLGLLNFGNIIFYVSAHRALPSQPAVVFASMNIGVVVLAALVGAAGFGERLSWVNRGAIVLAICAIALLAWPIH